MRIVYTFPGKMASDMDILKEAHRVLIDKEGLLFISIPIYRRYHSWLPSVLFRFLSEWEVWLYKLSHWVKRGA